MRGQGGSPVLRGIRTLLALGLAALAGQALAAPLSLLPFLSPIPWILAAGAPPAALGLLAVWGPLRSRPAWEQALGLVLAGAALAGFLPASFAGALGLLGPLEGLPIPDFGSALLLGLGYAAFLGLGRLDALARRWFLQGVEGAERRRGVLTGLAAWAAALLFSGLALGLVAALAGPAGALAGRGTAWLSPLVGALMAAALALGLYLAAFRR